MSEAAALVALAGLWLTHRALVEAQRLRATVEELREVLHDAEDLWADRHAIAVIDDDSAGTDAAWRTTANIAHAHRRLEARHGR